MLVGHKLLVKSFRNLVEADKLSHGYIFFGSDGVGKKTFALSLANFLENKKFDPIRGKETLRALAASNGAGFESEKILSDLFLVEPNEKKTIGIDAIRKLKNFLSQKPNLSLRRTAIIDEAEFMTTEAQNALLKIAEEPPASSLLILIVREPEIFAATLGSRLQKIYFSTIKIEEVEGWLKAQSVVNAGEMAKRSLGKPGLALKMAQNEKFKETQKLAERFLKTSGSTRKDFLKELLEPDDFDLLSFLDAVILQITNNLRIYESDNLKMKEKEIELWHRVLKLRQDFSNFPLNPKLQLLNL